MDYIIQKELGKQGLETLVVNGYYLHSKYNPIREAAQLADKFYKPHHLHILFGFGLGYIVEELIPLFKFNEPLLILDPLIDSGNLTMKKYDYSRLYMHNCSDIPHLTNLLDQLASYTDKITMLPSINYDKIAFNELSKITELIKEIKMKQIININTSNKYSMEWQINYFMNTITAGKDNSLKILEKRYDAPVVVVSAGPSLSKQLDLIKKNRNKMILICAGSAINTLLKEEIIPDYIVSIDGGIYNYRHFENLKFDEATLIYSPTHHYKIRGCFTNKALLFVPHVRPQIQKNYQKRFGEEYPIMNGGGSVAHFAFSIAKYITKGPICLIGQDLAFTDQYSHAAGNKLRRKLDVNSVEIREVEGYYNDTVLSNNSLVVIKNTLEELQALHPHENKVFNCTEGGAKIRYFNQLPFSEFIECYCTLNCKKEDISTSTKEKTSIFNEELEKYKEVLKLLKKGLEVINNDTNLFIAKNTLNKLSKIERQLNIFYDDILIDMLFEPEILFTRDKYLPQINETKLEEHQRVRKYTYDLYTRCKIKIEELIINIMEILEEQKHGT
ncbi:motility associated factor glycosyltransferase family protein [Lysinibacillus xylanilyticus]|uniref:motility associated factor glycosyltransferase family protein n=1 Tax=Lysinibacillus xylanilyticus TaxID=582475 RepID=UPI003D00934C